MTTTDLIWGKGLIWGDGIIEFIGATVGNSGVSGVTQQLSASGQTAMGGCYALRLISSSYLGPIVSIRRSSDNSISVFYSNGDGVLGQGLNGTGASITSWLNGATGYVAIWYDQSAAGNNATQTNTTRQPSINVSGGYIDFTNQTNSYLALPNGTIPYGDSAYTFVLKHGTPSSQRNGGFLGGGTWGGGSAVNAFRFAGSSYDNYWWGNDFVDGTIAANNTVTVKYTKDVSRTLYVNGVSVASQSSSGRASTNINNNIGVTNNNEYLNSQLYFLMIFNTDLTDADRLLMEAV